MDLDKLKAVITPLIESSGLSLYDVEFQGRILRVTIDKVGGVGINDCAEVSRLLNPVLDVEELVPGGRYELEVSSPGLDRALRQPQHFEQIVGHVINVVTELPFSTWNGSDPFFANRRRAKGILKQFDGEKLFLEVDGRECLIPMSALTKAHLDFDLKPTPKKGKK